MKISLDNFLDGKIKIYQPIKGYRAGTDAVLLAASIKTFKGYKILDIGSGAGTISFCLSFRCPGIEITGIEKNENYFFLSEKSLKLNKFKSKIKFFNEDLSKFKNKKFNIVVSNPPWYPKNSTYKSTNKMINEARVESIPLKKWITYVSNILRYNGEYYTIFPYRRIEEIKKILKMYFNIIKIYPLASFENVAPNRAIIYAKKSNNLNQFSEHNKIIIHKIDKSFVKSINNVLKKGSSLCLA